MQRIEKLETERVALSSLTIHPQNPRQGDIGALVQSLQAHGQYRTIVVQKSNGYILAGNHTAQAAMILGWSEIDAHVIDVDDDQALRILLMDNRGSDLATNNKTQQAQLLEFLIETDMSLKGTGFDGDDLDDLLFEFDPALHDFPKPAAPEPQAEDRGPRSPTTCPECGYSW